MPVRDYATLGEVDRANCIKASDRCPTLSSEPQIERAQTPARSSGRSAMPCVRLTRRLALASDPQPKRRGWFARVRGFVGCVATWGRGDACSRSGT